MLRPKALLAAGALCALHLAACEVDPETAEDASADALSDASGDALAPDGGGEPDAAGPAEPPAPTATAEFTDEATLVLTITAHADRGPYRFGLAETGNGGGDGWDGEDCIEGVLDDHDLCHDVPEDGVLALTSVHPDAGGDGLDDLEAGRTTLIYKAIEAGITYVLLRDGDDPNCWTWGHNPQHYLEALGCNPLPTGM